MIPIFSAFAITIYSFTVIRGGWLGPAPIFAAFATANLLLFNCIIFFEIDVADLLFTANPFFLWSQSDILVTNVFFILLITIGAISTARYGSVFRRNSSIDRNRRPKELILLIPQRHLLAVAISVGVINLSHLSMLDIDIFLANDTYLLLRDPESNGMHGLFGRLVNSVLATSGIVSGVLAIVAIHKRNFTMFFVFVVMWSYPLTILLSANSRWAPLYIALLVGTNAFLHGRVLTKGNIIAIACFLVIYLKVMIGRSQTQGFLHIFDFLEAVELSLLWSYAFGFVVNVFQGATNFANTLVLEPTYGTAYIMKSFSPFISAIDGFADARVFYEQRINKFMPVPAFAEAWHFGYFALTGYLFAWFVFLSRMQRIYVIGHVSMLPFVIASYYVILVASQYSIRTGFRLMLLLYVVSYLMDWMRKKMERKPPTALQRLHDREEN